MKVINVCKDDWANFSYDNAMAMKAVGIEAKSLKLNPHIHNYPEQSDIVSIEEMILQCTEADVIQFVHSDLYCFNHIAPHIPGKRINVIYTGTVYRKNPEVFNEIFNPVVDKSIIALGEFAGLGAKNEVYMVGAIDVSKFYFNQKHASLPYKFAHYPSNIEVKGTREIVDMMQEFQPEVDFTFNTKRVSFVQQCIRMEECDVYIELFKAELDKKKYGSWGITGLEAAALGKVVITMNLSSHVYAQNYGSCELITVEDEKQFRQTIHRLSCMPQNAMDYKKAQTRKWVEDKHSYKATGEYILKNIL